MDGFIVAGGKRHANTCEVNPNTLRLGVQVGSLARSRRRDLMMVMSAQAALRTSLLTQPHKAGHIAAAKAY